MKAFATALLTLLLIVGTAFGQTAVDVENAGFENATEKIEGFDDVPSWNTETNATSSGVEEGDIEGSYWAFLNGDDTPIYQTTDYTVDGDDGFRLRVDSKTSGGSPPGLRIAIYYEEEDGTPVVAAESVFPSSEVPDVSESAETFEVWWGGAEETPEAEGRPVGVLIEDPSGDSGAYLAVDNVRLDAGPSLPVEFAGKPMPVVQGHDVVLRWETLSEINNTGFYVKHRRLGAGASGWTKANPHQRVPTKAEGGTTNEAHTYSHRIRGLAPGRYVFRVQQVDLDGKSNHSPMSVEAEVGATGFALNAAYPNPVRASGATATMHYQGVPEDEVVEAVLFNSLGQQVRTLRPSNGRIELNAAGLSSGLYFVRLQMGDRVAMESITVVR